jgi:aspartate/methionine/tyrosine aminotransferase
MRRFPGNDIISLVRETPRYDLAESVGPDLHLSELLDGSTGTGLDGLPLGYGTAQGDARLREAIAGLHQVSPDDVVITVGGMHALFLIAFILCDQGAEAVTTAPLFPLARNTLEVVGAKVRTLSLSFDGRYQPDIAELRRLLSEKTRLVSVATPQNPSGVAITQPVLREILAAMRERCPRACLLVDETYREAAHGEDGTAPTAAALAPNVVSIASLSKCHGAPGLRLGWAITRDRALREQLVLGKFNTVVSCSPLDEALAHRVLQRRETILRQRRRHLAQNLGATADWVLDNLEFVDWIRPDAGAMCCVRLKRAVFDDAAVSRFYGALPGAGVRVGNGTWFGDEERVFRLGFGLLCAADLKVALASLTTALRHAARAAA